MNGRYLDGNFATDAKRRLRGLAAGLVDGMGKWGPGFLKGIGGLMSVEQDGD